MERIAKHSPIFFIDVDSSGEHNAIPTVFGEKLKTYKYV